jgi:catechol 2,3-dioxygenase-like lactoylglutathione lyase family enzyme
VEQPLQPPVARLQPMIHVEDMSASVRFYEALGARLVHGSRDGDFVLLDLNGTEFSLLAHPPNPDQNEGVVEFNLQAERLSDLEQLLRDAGVEIAEPTTGQQFGRQLILRSPDGLLIKINELDQDLYT